MSNGDGTFAVGTFSPGAGYAIPNGLWLPMDVNGDGKTDIVHAVQNSDYVHTWMSNGDGTFAVGTFSPWDGYAIPNGLWLPMDVNGDGKSDIVHAVQDSDYVHTWRSNGDGTFAVGTFSPGAGYAIPNGLWLPMDRERRRHDRHRARGPELRLRAYLDRPYAARLVTDTSARRARRRALPLLQPTRAPGRSFGRSWTGHRFVSNRSEGYVR